jgi:hypothetical protein
MKLFPRQATASPAVMTPPPARTPAVHRLPGAVRAAVAAAETANPGDPPLYLQVPSADLARLDALAADTRTALAVLAVITDAEAVLDRVRHVNDFSDRTTMATHLADALDQVVTAARALGDAR